MKKITYTASMIPVVLIGTTLSYSLPKVDVVRAVGVETKRVDLVEPSGSEQTRDVYFVQTEDVDTKKPHVYRNEDNFLYGKWDSADLQTKAQSFVNDRAVVAVRSYGWRIRFLSMFPNATQIWAVDPGYRHIPVFNAVVLSALGALLFLGKRKISQRLQRQKREAEVAEEARRQAQQETQARKSADVRADLDAFINDGDER